MQAQQYGTVRVNPIGEPERKHRRLCLDTQSQKGKCRTVRSASCGLVKSRDFVENTMRFGSGPPQ